MKVQEALFSHGPECKKLREENERIQLLLEGDTLLETTYKLKTKIRSLEEEIDRLRGEAPDAGEKSLRRSNG